MSFQRCTGHASQAKLERIVQPARLMLKPLFPLSTNVSRLTVGHAGEVEHRCIPRARPIRGMQSEPSCSSAKHRSRL